MTPRATMELLLVLPALHLTICAGAHSGTYRLACTQQWRPNLITSVTPKKSQHMELESIWSVTGCSEDMHSTSHSWKKIMVKLMLSLSKPRKYMAKEGV